MINKLKIYLLKLIFTGAILVTIPISLVFAAENSKTPESKTCSSSAYMSSRWNEDNDKTHNHKSLGYKKLICKTGREAYVLVNPTPQPTEYEYELINYLNEKVTEIDPDMCLIVDKFCEQ